MNVFMRIIERCLQLKDEKLTALLAVPAESKP